METLQKRLREEAARLLGEGAVKAVVGFDEGSLPLTVMPAIITKAEDAARLVWNPLCAQNLAKYVHDLISAHRQSQMRAKPEDRKKIKVAVAATGCATRSLVIHLNERQYERDEVVVLGMPCNGMVDRRLILRAAGTEELLGGELVGRTFKAATESGAVEIPVESVMAMQCRTCRYNNPIISDVEMGPAAPGKVTDREYDEVDAFEKMGDEERFAYFTAEMAKCMRCNACRNACPSCYCRICFADQAMPQWVGIGQSPADVQTFQFMRLFHMAGRCVDCGSCSMVCPMGVDLRKFLKKIEKDGWALFGNRVGVALNEPMLLATAKEDDPEEFIYNP